MYINMKLESLTAKIFDFNHKLLYCVAIVIPF